MTLNKKYNSLKKLILSYNKIIVAYSGGVDSTFLLKAAVDTLGNDKVLGCIAISASLPQSQHQNALEYARQIGAKIKQVQLAELQDENYSQNKADRCFHCKSHLYKELKDIAQQQGFAEVACGSNFDDKDDFRPGNRAANVLGIKMPLMQAKLTKDDIRRLSRELDLPTADIPASPCLASRVSYGLKITEQRLKQVELAEEFIRSLGFENFRVRHHDTIARIEVKNSDIAKICDEPIRTKIEQELKKLGFKFVCVDISGFRSGSMNASLTEQQKQKAADG